MPKNVKENRSERFHELCEVFRRNNAIPASLYDKYDVKRGLRNHDGTGVLAGLTQICNVHGYIIQDSERIPDEGRLIYRGIDVRELVDGCAAEQRFGFEETIWLLLFGELPDKEQLSNFLKILSENRELPEYFAEDMILKAPSSDVMNKLARSVLALYSYDENPDDTSLENVMRQSIKLIAHLPVIMSYAYQVKKRHYDHESMFFHPLDPSHSTAESILNVLRNDRSFTDEEAKLLDLCLILHAEHGGGNNSTFAARVLSSSGTDTYATIASAIGSLKGPKHGGANHKVMGMMNELLKNLSGYREKDQIEKYLEKIVAKDAGDRSGLIYGLGHAVYTLSDPRAVILKKQARNLAKEKGLEDVFSVFEMVEELAPQVFARVKGDSKVISANVDFYSGLVYQMLGIPSDLFTPLFAVSRIAGWCAHRIEELTTGGRIIRPAYKSIIGNKQYSALNQR